MLLSAGHEVRVMARHPAKLADVPWRQQAEVVEGDVTDGARVQQAGVELYPRWLAGLRARAYDRSREGREAS